MWGGGDIPSEGGLGQLLVSHPWLRVESVWDLLARLVGSMSSPPQLCVGSHQGLVLPLQPGLAVLLVP